AERLDARRVPQVEAEDLEPVLPVLEVRLPRVSRRRVAREAGRHDQVRTGAEELDPGLVADLHPSARQQRDAAAQVGGLRALAEVEVAALRAELVVERVQLAVLALADVAVVRLEALASLRGILVLLRREDVRRREHRPLAEDADAGLRAQLLVAAQALV